MKWPSPDEILHVAVEIQDRYDGAYYWPECGSSWQKIHAATRTLVLKSLTGWPRVVEDHYLEETEVRIWDRMMYGLGLWWTYGYKREWLRRTRPWLARWAQI